MKISRYFPVLYAAPVSYYAFYIHSNAQLVKSEPFIKQTLRNRTRVYGANGIISLTIPLQGATSKAPMNELNISSINPWQAIHWKTLVSAYKSSPFFEFYAPLFEPLYQKEYTRLVDFNLDIHGVILQCLESAIPVSTVSESIPFIANDLRHIYQRKKDFFPAYNFPQYQQVFSYSGDFFADISIYDLLFNLGPESTEYLIKVYQNLTA